MFRSSDWLRCVAIALAWGRHALAKDSSDVEAEVDIKGGLSEFQEWFGGLVIPVPSGLTGELPFGVGNMTLTGGSCWNLRVGNFESKDLSDGQRLHFNVAITGFAIQCYIEGDSDGDMQINITFGPSSLALGVSIDPAVSFMAPEYPLPLGRLNMTACSADLVVIDAGFAGNAPIVEVIQEIPHEDLIVLIGTSVKEPFCQEVNDFLNGKGQALVDEGLMIVEPILLDTLPLMEPEPPLKPLLSWDHYPPMLVVQAMLRERFHLWADRVIHILDVNTFESKLVTTTNVSLMMKDIKVEGVGPRSRPGLQLLPSDQSINVFVNMNGLTLHTLLGVDIAILGQPSFTKEVGVVLGLNNLSAGVRAWVDTAQMDTLDLNQVLKSPQCFFECTSGTAATPTDALAVEHMLIGMKPLLQLDIPGSLEGSVTALVNSIVSSLYEGYLPTLNRLVNGGLATARYSLNAFMWEKIQAMPECGRSDVYMGVSEGAIQSCWSAAVVCCGVGLLVSFAMQFFRLARFRVGRPAAQSVAASQHADVEASNEVSNVAPSGAAEPQQLGQVGQPQQEQQDRCLAFQPCVPTFLIVLFPFAVLSVMFLFLFADLDIGASVSLLTRAAGSSSLIGPIFSFSLLSTVIHSWHSGAHIISVVTLLTSGIWPFIKLSLLLACWLCPPRILPVKLRSRILNLLDVWGKYSFVDSWFLVLSMSAFALDWHSVGNQSSMKVLTVPTPAFYAYFLATSASIFLGLVAFEQHKKSVERAQEVADFELSQARRYAIEHSDAQRLCRFMRPKRFSVLISSLLAATVVLTFVGIFMLSFTFEVDGVAMEFLYGQAVSKQYSLLDVGTMVAEDRYNDVGLLGLEVVFMALAIIVPVINLASLTALWAAPLKISGQRALLRAGHILNAWSTFDVAVVVLMVSCFEFGVMAEFLVQKSGFAAGCNMIKDLTHEECLRVAMDGNGIMVILCIAGILHMVLPRVLLRFGNDLVERRISDILEEKTADMRKKSNSSDLSTRISDSKATLSVSESFSVPVSAL